MSTFIQLKTKVGELQANIVVGLKRVLEEMYGYKIATNDGITYRVYKGIKLIAKILVNTKKNLATVLIENDMYKEDVAKFSTILEDLYLGVITQVALAEQGYHAMLDPQPDGTIKVVAMR